MNAPDIELLSISTPLERAGGVCKTRSGITHDEEQTLDCVADGIGCETIERELAGSSPEKAETSSILGVDCNVDDRIAAMSTGQFGGNADYNAAKYVARKLARMPQRGQTSPAGGAVCQYALKSGMMPVTATDVVSDQYVSAERESIDRLTASAVGR